MRVAVFAALILAGCTESGPPDTAGDASALTTMLAGRAPASAERCVSLSTIDGPTVVGDTLVYRDGRRLLVSPVRDCPSLRADPIVIVETYAGQVCTGDRFYTVPRGGSIPGPYCRFGAFTPWAL